MAAETWEIILFVIVAILLLIIIISIAITIWTCNKTRTRWKSYAKKEIVDWGTKKKKHHRDEKSRVIYDVERGQVVIVDEWDTGVKQYKKVMNETNRSQAEDEVDSIDIRNMEKYSQNLKTKTKDQNIVVQNNNIENSQQERLASCKSNHLRKCDVETNTTVISSDNKAFDQEDSSNIQALPRKKRERLEPLTVLPTAQHSGLSKYVQNSNKSYTNLGYSEDNHGYVYQPATCHMQQPAAVIRTIVHPGPAIKIPKTKSRHNSQSLVNVCQQPRTASYNHWSLEAMNPDAPPSWVTIPIRYKAGRRNQRRLVRRASRLDFVYSSSNGESELEWDSDYNRWKFKKGSSCADKMAKHSFKTQADGKKKRERRLSNTRRYSSDVVYIKDATSPQLQSIGPLGQAKSMFNLHTYAGKDAKSSEKYDQSGYYSKDYQMVQRSEFPAGRRDPEPDMVSITTSTSSEFYNPHPTGPPRPNTQSEEANKGNMSGDEENNGAEYSNGSYIEYSRQATLAKQDMGVRRKEVGDERTKFNQTHQGTLENMTKVDSSFKVNDTAEEKNIPPSQIHNNEEKKQRFQISGVQVLPTKSLYVQAEDTHNSDEKVLGKR